MERERGRRGSSSSALNYLKKPFSWKLGALKLRRSKSTEAASFPVFDPSSATIFDNENSNFVSFNSELDSAVSQYLSQVTELGYRPTSGGPNLSTFKADWKDGHNSVASVNSRTSERLLAVQFQLNSSDANKSEGNESLTGQVNNQADISIEHTPDNLEKEPPSTGTSLSINAAHSSTGDSSSTSENYYENGHVSVTDEPIYENLDGSCDEVFKKEPLYDTVPRRPQAPPKPESLARTLSQENIIDSSRADCKQNSSSVSEDSQCTDDTSGDSLSAESLSDSLSQDIERSSKRRKKKNRENTDESLIVDGSETSDLGSSGSEDVASIDEWLSNSPPRKTSTSLSVSFEVKGTASSKPETALELLEGEVLAEAERERSLCITNSIPTDEKNSFTIPGISDDEDSSAQAINSSIVEVCRSHDEIDEARIIDDVSSSSSEDISAVPAIRHSVIIELKGSEKEEKCFKHELKRSGSLHASGSDSERNLRKNKSSKKKNRRMSETGLGVCVGVTHNSNTNTKEFFEVKDSPISNQIIEIGEDGSWGLKNLQGGDSKSEDVKTSETLDSKSDKSLKQNIIKSKESKNTDIRAVESPKKVLKLPTGKKKRAAGTSVVKKQKVGMDGSEVIAAPPDAFLCSDGLDGVFSASCVALTSEPSSLASSLATEPSAPEEQEKIDPEVTEPADSAIIVKEIPQENLETEPKKMAKSNLGSAIMESYDKEMNRKKESLNLPEVSMLDFGHSAFDLEIDRKNVIKQMIVKTKKKESWFGRAFATDGDGPKVTSVNSVKRSNSMSCVATPNNKSLLSSKGKEVPKDLNFMNMKNAATKAKPPPDEDDIVFPSFMSDAELINDQDIPAKTPPPAPIEPIPSIELTIKKLGIDDLSPVSPPYKLNKHLTTITPFKPPSQNKHSSIKNITSPLLSHPMLDDLPSPTDDSNLSESIPVDVPKNETQLDEAVVEGQVTDFMQTVVEEVKEEAEDVHIEPSFESTMEDLNLAADDDVQQSTIPAETLENHRAKGEVDVASILEQKQTTKLYWEHKMAATAAPPAEDLGWEPVANVCFRDPNATPDTDIPEETGAPATTSAGTDFLPAPPPQFDNTPPVSIQEAKDAGHKLEQEKIISLDDEISVLEREVLGEVVASDVDEDIEDVSPRFVEESVKTNHKYVYGEEGAQEDVPKVLSVVQNRRGDPDRLPTVKSTYGAATQCKENVIEAEIRAQQERERELQLEQMKKKELLQQTSNSVERHKGASSPQDSDEGFVDPPVERSKLEGATKQTVSVVCNGGGYAHLVTDPHGDSVIYDAVEPPKLTSPRTQLETPSPVPPKAAPKPAPAPVPHTTETKIALEIRELKEREEELRRMREARQGVKKVNSGAHEEEAQEDFAEVDIEDVEDKGSSSSREILDDHLTSLTTTTDEGNFSECGDATSSEDKSSNGSNSRIMSPEVPSVEFPRPPRRVTVRPFQADDDEDRPVYTRMKNESVIEREIRIAKERDEAYKKEKGLLSATPAAPKSSNGAVTNGVVKHAPLQHSVSLSAVQNGSSKGAQHQLATSRIQMEIAENGQRERELMSAGKVLTLSEDTVDDKVTRLSDLADLPTAQEVRTKSPVSSTSVNSSTRQSPAVSPSSTLSSSSRASNSGLSNGHHFNGSTMTRLTKSLSTTNLSSPQSSLSSTGTTMRPKGLMEKFIASRGKMTPSAFASPPPAGGGPNRVVVTRPMRVQPKKPVLLRQHSNDSTDGGSIAAPELRPEGRTGPSPPPLYKRVIGAEEKIQEELREMQQREEELKRLRSKNLTARSQPNLLEMSLNEIPFEDDHSSTAAEDETDTATETEDSADTVIRAAVSNPNLADDVSENIALKKSARRRSALIAEWENRIQSTAAVDA